MADFEPVPFTTSSSAGFSHTSDARLADPFDPTTVTWTVVDSSTTDNWGGFWIIISTGNTVSKGIFLVATGATSSETIIASCPTSWDTSAMGFSLYVPVAVSSGTQVQIGISSETSQAYQGQIVGIKSSIFDATPSFTVMESGPYSLANDADYGRWYVYDPGATTNTKGSWDTLTYTGGNNANNVLNGNSLANAYDWIGCLYNKNFNTGQGNYYHLCDWGYGATPTLIYENVATRFPNTERGQAPILWTPSGAAASAVMKFRAQANANDINDRLMGVIMFGLR